MGGFLFDLEASSLYFVIFLWREGLVEDAHRRGWLQGDLFCYFPMARGIGGGCA